MISQFQLRKNFGQSSDQALVLIHRGRSLGDDVLVLFDRLQVIDIVGNLTVDYATVRRLEEAVIVGARIHSQRVDQTVVRTFRGLDRADTTIGSAEHTSELQ